MNTHYEGRTFDKRDPVVLQIKDWVDAQYESGRVTLITDEELETVSKLALEEASK
jgi:uncharacterized ubiquitin-like protein YukD